MFEFYAPKYIENSYFVIPLNGKFPILPEWQIPKDLNTYENIYSTHQGCNIGLLTGVHNGIVALDIDSDSSVSLCPESPVVKKGARGETRFFKYNGEITCKNAELKLDLLSTGAQTVLPPSIHPVINKPYIWTRGSLLEIDKEDLPIIPVEFLATFFNGSSKLSSGRHDTLLSICFAKISRGDGFNETVDEILRYDQEAHHGHKDGQYFLDNSEGHKGKGRSAAENMVRSCTKTVSQKEVKHTQRIEIKLNQLKDNPVSKVVVEMPAPHGIIKDVYDYVLSISNKPRPKFAMASALAFVGTILSNRVKLNKTTPNLYQILITDSGQGKDVPLKTPKNIFLECGMQRLVGLEHYRSDKLFVYDLPEQRERLDTVDEISKLFKTLKSHSSFSSNIAEMITEVWGSSIGYFKGFKVGGESIGACFNPCVSILSATTPSSFQQHFTVDQIMQGFGARFLYIFDDESVDIRRAKEIPIPQSIKDFCKFWNDVPKDKEIYPATDLGLFKIDLKEKCKTPITEIDRPLPQECVVTEQADKLMLECMHHYDRRGRDKNNGVLNPILQRCAQQIDKISIISAVARRPDSKTPLIDAKDVEFAKGYVDMCLEMTTVFLAEHLPQSKFHGDVTKVFNIIKDAGPDGVTRSNLSNIASSRFGINRDQLYNKDRGIIAQLLEQESIASLRKEGKTKPTEIYVALKSPN